MWYEDLTNCDFFGKKFPITLTTIGWLEIGKTYITGKVPTKPIDKIYQFSQTSGMYIAFCGYHNCDFCEFVDVGLGAKTIMIAYKNKTYYCPALIIHYIKTHNYLPPNEFIEAVLNYDHNYAMTYFKEKIKNRFPKVK